MGAIIRAIFAGSASDDKAPLDKIIALGKKALRQKAEEELALDLLGLDGVCLPLERGPGVS
jgi:high-affinity K+ transport system ATPase subunit B